MEYWMPIKEHESYSVSTLGRVWSAKNGLLKTPLNNCGYPTLNLCKNGIRFKWLVHRLMMVAFMPNPEKKKEVNHINGIRNDNRLENLEWVTSSENKIHRRDVLNHPLGYHHNRKRKTITARKEGVVLEFLGVRETARSLGIPYQAVQNLLKGKGKTYKGWKFELANPILMAEIDNEILNEIL